MSGMSSDSESSDQEGSGAPLIAPDQSESLIVDTDASVCAEAADESSVLDDGTAIEGGDEKVNSLTNEAEDAANQSRELKSLLALSKEANLDTNIPRKRKVVNLKKRLKGSKNRIQYPVTAETELEMELDEDGLSPTLRAVKRKKSLDSIVDSEESPKRSRKSFSTEIVPFKPDKDMFCWRCHKDAVNICCETCPRSYHQKCLKQTITNTEHWPCPECVSILKAESTQTRSPALKGMTLEHLCSLLKFAVHRMIQCQGSEPFIHAVSDIEFPDYKKYIIQPMDLTLLEKNIKENMYGSPQAFEADAKWILHNSIVFNSCWELSLKSDTDSLNGKSKKFDFNDSLRLFECMHGNCISHPPVSLLHFSLPILADQSKLTSVAKTIMKICKQEMSEIENCPSCYLNANTKKKTWFVEVCPKPHLLVWAKLRGFPYWPGKAMSCRDGLVDVRFFGAHDRAWVPEKECFLYSPKDPNLFRAKRTDIEQCVEELEVHVENLKKIYGEFNYPPFKTPLDPHNETKQLQLFLPSYKPQAKSNDLEEEAEESNHGDDTMEGYGTDEDSSEIDTEKRKDLLKNREPVEDDHDDTQVPADVSAVGDTVTLTRRSFKGHRKAESEPSSKRPSLDEIAPSRLRRRNSETMMNVPEEVQDPICSVQDNVVVSSTGNESAADFSAEIKKKPIQVDVDNVEFTISPTSKLRMADTLMRRLADEEQEEETHSQSTEVEQVKKNLTVVENGERWTVEDGNSSGTKIVLKAIRSEEADKPGKSVTKIIIHDPGSGKSVKETDVEEASKTKNAKRKKSVDVEEGVLENQDKVLEVARKVAEDKEIKSEPDSDDNNDLEAKKRYLSALNILEKGEASAQKPKTNEIRTRSKTEEKRERNKQAKSRELEADSLRVATPPPPPPAPKKSNASQPNEIFVKSFAKINSSLASKQRARKSFPQPNYVKAPIATTAAHATTTAKTAVIVSSEAMPRLAIRTHLSTPISTLAPTIQPSRNVPPLQQIESIRPTSGYLILQSQQQDSNVVFLSTNQSISYPSSLSSQMVSMTPCLVSAPSSNGKTANSPESASFSGVSSLLNGGTAATKRLVNGLTTEAVVSSSNGVESSSSGGERSSGRKTPETGGVVIVPPETPPAGGDITENGDDPELTLLTSVSGNVARAVNEIIKRPMPKLKPRPPGILSKQFAEGPSSAAGPIATKINSVAHRMSDYFRGMLIETLEDLGKSDNPEATIASLKMEIETLKHNHRIEMKEIERNVTTMLKDIQQSIGEEKERVVEETRAACEAEALRRINEAKSKQWCANCPREAQLYCCWNTSYCDYPCQQKHWPNHMAKCTQQGGGSGAAASLTPRSQQLILRPANPPPKGGIGKVFKKPVQKVYMNRNVATAKTMRVQTTSGNVLTMMETAPGNFQVVTSGQVLKAASPAPAAKATPASAKSVLVPKQSPVRRAATTNTTQEPVPVLDATD